MRGFDFIYTRKIDAEVLDIKLRNFVPIVLVLYPKEHLRSCEMEEERLWLFFLANYLLHMVT